MAKGLVLGKGLTLPLDAATSSIAILGSSGSGKSNTLVRLFEQLVGSGIPTVAIDPKGDWWGVRTTGDGSGPGLSVPIFGGLRGDAPLEPGMGERLAELLVAEQLSALLDVSRLSHAARARFLIDFLHRLFALHQENPTPRHVIVEEAHRLVPQTIPKGEDQAAALKEATAKVVLEGRAFGLGFTAASQRSARLNNDVLEEVWTLIVHNTRGPADRAAIRGWVRGHPRESEILDSLQYLEPGVAWLWSPTFLRIVERFHMYRRETFDSGATPKVGVVRQAARTMADVDMAAINRELSEVVERAKANDPAELRKQIVVLDRKLQRQIETAQAELAASRMSGYDEGFAEAQATARATARPSLDEAMLSSLEDLLDPLAGAISRAQRELRAAAETAAAAAKLASEIKDDHARQDLPGAGKPGRRARAVERTDVPAERAHSPSRRTPRGAPLPGAAQDDELVMPKMGKGEEKVLGVLASYPDGVTQKELAFLAGYSTRASTLGVILSRLRKRDLVTQPRADKKIALTSAGVAAAGGIAAMPTGPALLEYWRNHQRVGVGERKVIDVLIEAYPDSLDHLGLCDATGYSPGASTIGVILSRLRKLGLVEKNARRMRDDLMDAIGVSGGRQTAATRR